MRPPQGGMGMAWAACACHVTGVDSLRITVDSVVELLLGARCPGCLAPGPRVCVSCLDELSSGRVAAASRILSPPLPIWAAGSYGGVTRRLLTAFKERRRASLAGVLGVRLAMAVAGLVIAHDVWEPLVLVPVPSRPDVVRRRTYDAVALLATEAAGLLGSVGLAVEVRTALRHRRHVLDQAGLGHQARTRNVHGALAGQRVDGALAVVVDDIITTGASVAESARALRAAGSAVLGAAGVASTVMRRRLS